MKRYKIALVCDWFLPRIGGIELNMRDLAKNLIARGHDVQVITALPGPEVVDGIKVHRLNVPVVPGIKLAYGRRTIKELKKVLQKENYDVVHGHYLLSTLAHISIYLAKKMNIGTVFTHHSINYILHNRVALFLLPMIGCTIGALGFRIFTKARSYHADVITAVSGAVAHDTSKVFRTDVSVLANGIDVKEWQHEKRASKEFHITSVMRLCKSKQPLKLVRAIPKINKRLPEDIRPIYTIFGDGPEREKFAHEARELGVADQVRLMGFRSRCEIKEMFAQTKLFVLPSCREGFGIAVLEARTAGIPVVSMNHGGVSDILTHGQDGYLANTYSEFEDYIVELILNDSLRAQFTEAASKPLARFSWDQIIQRHLEAYEQAMERYPTKLHVEDHATEDLPKRRYGT